MKRQLVGLIVLLVVFVGMLTTILVNSKYIFRNEPYYSETQVEKMCDDAYMQSIKDNSDQALYDKMSELTIKNLELVNKNEELLLEKETLLSTISSNNDMISSLNSTIFRLEENKSKNEQEIEDLILEVESLEKENKLLVYEVSQKNLLIEENNKTILQLQNSISYYQDFINGLETEYEVFAIFIVENEVFNIQKLNKNGLAYLETEPTVSENCVFNGWKVNGELIDLSTYQLTCNTTFVANLKYYYNVNFIVEGSVYDSQTILENSYVSLPNTPSKAECEFLGWTLDGVNVIDNINNYAILSNTNFIALFSTPKFGLFSDDGSFIMSWTDLSINRYISYSNNVLSAALNTTSLSGHLVIKDGITEIAADCFKDCSSLTGVTLPESLVTLGNNAFYNCVNLSLIEYYPQNCQVSGMTSNCFAYAGSNTDGITLNIHSTVSIINRYTFYGLSGSYTNSQQHYDSSMPITELNFYGENLKKIDWWAFRAIKVTSLEIPDSVEEISNGAFYASFDLVDLKLSKNLKILGSQVFSYCKNLKSVYLPLSLTEVTSTATSASHAPFYGISGLSIYCEVDEKPSGWSLYSFCFDSSTLHTVYYAYSYEEYLLAISSGD